MKYLAWFSGIIATLVVGLYVLVFTSLGNSIVQPIVESKIKEQTKLDTRVSVFSLSMSDFEIFVELNANNTISLKGNYSLFSQAFDIKYDVKLDELSTLKALSGVELRSAFHTSGEVTGNMAFMQIDGVSDLASSNTTYHIELTDLNPTSIIAKVKNLQLDKLLDIGAQKQYASADVNLDINFKSIQTNALDGDILLTTKDGKINSDVMKKDFNITIPSTNFTMKLEATLKDDAVDYKYNLKSNLFKISSSGNLVPEPFKTDIKYALNIKELALLKPIIGVDGRGAFKLSGSAKGTKENLLVDGKSNIASSNTTFEAVLKEFSPLSVKASVKNLQLAKLLYMIKQPHYTDGLFSMDADITDARIGMLQGKVTSSIKKGLLDSNYMSKAYEFKTKMPKTTYKLNTATTLNGDVVDTKISLISSLAKFNVKRARFDIKTASLVSDYKVKVPNLDKLFFVTGQHMKGSLKATGELKKDKDLDLNVNSKVAGGTLVAQLHNDDFHADIKNMQTLKLLHMLIYPEIFKSSLNGKLDYNLARQKGVFNGTLADGKFTENKTFNLLKRYGEIDLYKEKFSGEVSAKINKEKILASLDLTSRKASIKTTDTKLNTMKNTIDSKIAIVANTHSIDVGLSGKTSKPKVSVDMKKLMESKAGDKVKKEVGRLLKGLF